MTHIRSHSPFAGTSQTVSMPVSKWGEVVWPWPRTKMASSEFPPAVCGGGGSGILPRQGDEARKAGWSDPARRRAVAAGGARQRTSQVLCCLRKLQGCCLRKLQERKLQGPPIKPPKKRRTSAGAKTQHLGDMRAVDGRLDASAVAHRRRAEALAAIKKPKRLEILWLLGVREGRRGSEGRGGGAG